MFCFDLWGQKTDLLQMTQVAWMVHKVAVDQKCIPKLSTDE